jgi:predicted permease
MFSVVDGVLLRQLPYETPGELVSVWATHPDWRDHPFLGEFWDKGPVSWPEYEIWRESTTLFQSVAVHGEFTMTLTGLGDPNQISVGLASAGLFQTLGVRPLMGRGFLPGEDGPTAERLAVLSHSLWRTRFAADPSAIGRTLTLDGHTYSIAGVLPSSFRLRTLVLGRADEKGDRAVWIPVGQPEMFGGLENVRVEAIGRLAPCVSIEQAQSETESLFAGDEDPPSLGARLVARKHDETDTFRTPLFLLLGAAGVLLLAACSNVAMLAVGEAAGRRHEIATRASLGAGTSRIVRQALTESVLLGLLGSALGAMIALIGTSALVALGPPIPRIDDVNLSLRVLLFASIAGMLTGVLFGIAPAALFARQAGAVGLRESGSRTIAAGRKIQRYVVTLEIALTAVLLVAGGLLARSLANLFAVETGLRAANLATFHVPLPETRYPSGTDATEFFLSVQQRLEAVPGVQRASGTAALPFGAAFEVETPVLWFRIVGRETAEDEPNPQAWRGTALPHYHETLGVPVLAGRGLTEADDAYDPKVMVINEAMARRYWHDESPVGATVELGNEEWTIVGIVGNVRHAGLDVEVEPMAFLPQSQHQTFELSFVARTSVEPSLLLPLLRQAVWSVDPNVPVTRMKTMASLVAESGSQERYRTLLMILFAVTAVVLAAGGVFGVAAQGVARQTRELGIRLALGARENSLLGMVLRGSMLMAVAGTTAGLLLAMWTSRFLSSFLFAIEASDPLTYGLAAMLLIAVCVVASLLPAKRASRVDPVEVLRAE